MANINVIESRVQRLAAQHRKEIVLDAIQQASPEELRALYQLINARYHEVFPIGEDDPVLTRLREAAKALREQECRMCQRWQAQPQAD